MGDAKRKKLTQESRSSNMAMINKTPGQLVPPGMKTIVFLSPQVDSCVEKIVGEMASYWKLQNIFPIVINEKKCKVSLDYLPSKLILFRSATRSIANHEVNEIATFVDYMKVLGIRITYYLDDFLVGMNKGAPAFLMSKADEIIVATEAIKDYICNEGKLAGKPVTIIKTHIDFQTMDKLSKSDLVPEGYYNILFTSEGRIGALMLYRIVEFMNQYINRYKDINIISVTNGVAQVRSIINKFRNIKKTYYERLSLTDFYKVCKSVDLILSPGEIGDLDYMVPREIQQNWLDSKSCVKYTLAGASSIPCIVSKNMREYRQSVQHEKTGFIAESLEEWVKYIDLLHNDREFGKKIGEEARKDIEENYNLEKRSLEMLDAINGKPKVRIKDQKRIFLPPIAGGPRSFYHTLKKYLPIVSQDKMIITGELDESTEAAIVVAFVGANQILEKKEEYPNLKIISRVDGLPFDFEGNIMEERLQEMLRVMNKADLIVWQSKFSKKVWEPYYTGETKSIIIYNGVDLGVFKPEGEKFPLDTNKLNVLYVNFSTQKYKRFDILEDLIKRNIDNKNIHFTLVGYYTDTSIINDMERWGIYPNVTYLGPIDYSDEGRKRLASLYRAANVLLFTSEHEGCSNTLLESTACGLPVIYNDATSIVPELLGDNCVPLKDWDRMIKGELQPIEGLDELAEKFSAIKMAENYYEALK